ncbi:hypothetical protein FOXG_18880 [Fusarium oxysporum f. sp. lycopersici 4287]|uniref:G-protein coupled receptors family 2 profile 2 domain-containing protein n=1 Tax=Fusarium oxysporum f. sp. lycopersici (strain 4287 / CBS 123668 / FGSC 9935 / NRRL 34936) TaxID=426428 RepID=A0A0J9WK54_FUSO4|nr:hypothetical protein FOXG_18880 [Fusarium oxysporum f. sp. lycopersici 4287]KNB01437.1 hypothetical protein FOXG_18880 [Fusarium oxysporum f. sp. lycopersici 4287]
MAPTPSQAHTLALLERIGGCLSLVAVFLIFIAYGLMARLQNPRNTFIIMASIANLGASIACIIARDGLAAGQDSALCKAQAFMLQMFIQSDAWWALGMAINDEKVHSTITTPLGPDHGPGPIWCSVSDNWSNVRIFASFTFVWPLLVGSVVLNFIVGYHIFHSRNQVRNLSNSMGLTNTATRSHPENTVYPVVVTEFHVTRGPVSPVSLPAPAHTQLTLGLLETSLHETPNQYLSTTTSLKSTPRKARVQRGIIAARTLVFKCRLEDPVKRVYLRATFLFTLSVVVSWTPVSINRFHSFLYGSSPFPYQVATVALLPLQGVWNAVIFYMTSHKILRDWAQDQRART